MKKAVVLEIKEEYAAVLTEEGFVQKIRNNAYAVGQEIDLDEIADQEEEREERRGIAGNRFAGWYRGVAAAAAVFIISGSGFYYASENVFAYSTVTVTTDAASLELTLNKKDEVVAVKALDEESEETASALQISAMRRKPLSDTMDRITEGQSQAEVSVSSRNTERRERLEEQVADMLPPAPASAQTEVQNTDVPDKMQHAGVPEGNGAEQSTQHAGVPEGNGAEQSAQHADISEGEGTPQHGAGMQQSGGLAPEEMAPTDMQENGMPEMPAETGRTAPADGKENGMNKGGAAGEGSMPIEGSMPAEGGMPTGENDLNRNAYAGEGQPVFPQNAGMQPQGMPQAGSTLPPP